MNEYVVSVDPKDDGIGGYAQRVLKLECSKLKANVVWSIKSTNKDEKRNPTGGFPWIETKTCYHKCRQCGRQTGSYNISNIIDDEDG